MKHRDPIKVVDGSHGVEPDQWELYVVSFDGSHVLITKGTKAEIERKAGALRAANQQTFVELKRQISQLVLEQ